MEALRDVAWFVLIFVSAPMAIGAASYFLFRLLRYATGLVKRLRGGADRVNRDLRLGPKGRR